MVSIREATAEHYVETLAWVVMPDHLHWLLVPRQGALDAVVRRIKSRSAAFINREINTRGALWQKGYHDHALRKDEEVRAVARYIVANPLRARIVEHIGDYPLWDSIFLRR